MKEEFVLPQNWCVHIDKGQIVPNKYKCPHYTDDYYVYSHKINGPSFNYYTGKHKMNGYSEISFEEFKEYVLKEYSKDYSYLIPLLKRLNIT